MTQCVHLFDTVSIFMASDMDELDIDYWRDITDRLGIMSFLVDHFTGSMPCAVCGLISWCNRVNIW